MRERFSCVCHLFLVPACFTSLVNVAFAQAPAPRAVQTQQSSTSAPKSKSSKRGGSSSSWRATPSFQVGAEYDNNVFLLAPTKKVDVTAPTTAEAVSGRYTDMKNPTDLLTTMSASLTVKGPGFIGKTSQITPEISYELYTQNPRRSNVSFGLSVQQDAWADGKLRLQGSFMPSYFARNYLADAVDLDSDGSISAAERIYASGEYREGQVGADYRLPLTRSTKMHPFGASVQLGGGYYGRSYDAPLDGRDLHGPTANAKLLVALGRRIGMDLGYSYSALRATRSNQVLLLNEADFGQDLNGNGSNSDPNARVLTMVDRSRREHSLGATLRLEGSKKVDLSAGYEYRWRRYTSVEPLDVVDRGRRDNRQQVSADLRYRLTRDLRARFGGVYSSQYLNRTGDPGSAGEIDDYTRSQIHLGLAYQL